MGELIRKMDWSKTALGPIEAWPQSLRTSVSLCLSSTFPILIAWGPETIQIYNDSYRPICGAKHPESMGQNFRICWETALPVVGDKFTRGQHGEGTYIKDQRMFLDRYGYLEEAFMTFSFAPIRDESGGVGGIFHPITETTEKMLSARRTQVLKDLGAAIGKAKTVQEIAEMTRAQYEDYQLDVPFISFYQLKDNRAILITAVGIEAGSKLAPSEIDIKDEQWPFYKVSETGDHQLLSGLANRFGDFTCAPYEFAPDTAIVLPVRITGQNEPFGFMVAGVSACRAIDEDYLNFYEQLAGTYNTAVSNVFAYEHEQKRAEALAEIDRSKTAFFSNVSHEFRTPLTLMLGPLEELLQDSGLSTPTMDHVSATHRNALRLLKLVNNLLDYSRVEAGRIQAAYQPLDLTELTIDLTSSFRSIIEKAGMELVVECDSLTEVSYIDRQMWEKITLNLLSNAFKYTLQGRITVKLQQKKGLVILTVQDTGIGIPDKELPHMFERFHRVENAAGRTHEGTGIGLSLVHELVQLHGGEITVSSVEGEGSSFSVRIPTGKAHLPPAQVVETQKDNDNDLIKGAFIREAYNLLQEEQQSLHSGDTTQMSGDLSSHQDHTQDKQTRILIVDDNADMRSYLKRLLDPYFTVETAVNGKQALEKVELNLPNLILSDIMMPVMDGKTMLGHIRGSDRTSTVPVLFLSARAGEEARIDGLEAGADDYLVKPFSAAELLTKVRAQIYISKTRGHAEQQLRKLNNTLQLAMDASKMGLWRSDVKTDALYVSETARRIHGIPLDQELTYSGALASLVIPEHRANLNEVIATAIKQNSRFSENYQIDALDGSGRKWINSSGMMELDENGEVHSVVGTILDITEQKADEIRKNDFIGMVSHELKTPLTSLAGFAQLGHRSAVKKQDESNASIYDRINIQMRKMSNLINGFLNISQLESGKINLNPSHFSLDELINESVSEINVTSPQQKFELDCDPVMLYADHDKIGTVLVNLLSNAIKYGKADSTVTVGCRAGQGKVKIYVKDEGIGIKEEDLDKLFDRYYRVQSDRTQHISGFGIGLYLCSEIINRHNGRIWAESEIGQGTTFHVELPAGS
ncbi:MAG: response regulator [Pedobacter sp.]|nr:MAG: response regulator [Pedobacter sp.]